MSTEAMTMTVEAFNRLATTHTGRLEMIQDLVQRHRYYMEPPLVMMEQVLLAEETAGPDKLEDFSPPIRKIAEMMSGKPFSEVIRDSLAGREAALKDLRAMIAARKALEATK